MYCCILKLSKMTNLCVDRLLKEYIQFGLSQLPIRGCLMKVFLKIVESLWQMFIGVQAMLFSCISGSNQSILPLTNEDLRF